MPKNIKDAYDKMHKSLHQTPTMKKEYKALAPKVLAVAVEGSIKDWSAYIGTVKGNNHDSEAEEVARHGTKIQKEIAEFLFPNFAKEFKWRY